MAKRESRSNAGNGAPSAGRRWGIRRKPAPESKPQATRGSSKKSAPACKTGPAGVRKRPIKEPPAPNVDLPPMAYQNKVPRLTNEGFSLDRKLDLLGVGLLVLAIIVLLGYVSEPGTVIGSALRLLGQVFGWYAPLSIVLVGVVGLWLILRNFREKPARLQVFRLVGFVCLCVVILSATHFIGMNFSPNINNLDFEEAFRQAERGEGGGYIGAYLYAAMVGAVGAWGAAIVLVGALVASVMLTFGLTISEIADFFQALHRRVRGLGAARRGVAIVQTPAVVAAPPALQDATPAALPQGAEPAAETPLTSDAAAPADTLYGPPSLIVTPGKDWELPSYREILDEGAEAGVSDTVLLEQARIIEDTLHSFGAPGRVVEVNPGPVVTQFGVEPDYIEGRAGKKIKVKVNKIAALADDLALALAAKSVRVEAPVPGKGFVGVEVPNPESALVKLRDVMDSASFGRIRSRLAFGLGQSVDGEPVAADLAAMPHLLIAGATGSGKSVCVNAIIACLLLRNTPDDVRLIMVDPKRVELTNYNGIPHLVTPVVTDLERIVGVLKWVTREMDERYRKFAQAGTRNILGYNRKVGKGGGQLPYLVVIIDELADLMMMAPEETERVVTRIAQMARATGIHLIIATQRPSVDVVTGLIKANFPARIAFAVASQVDSRVILDMPGAERLLGRGDMLFQSPDAAAPMRMQGVHASDEEINRIVTYWRKTATENGNTAGALPVLAESAAPEPQRPPRSTPQRPQQMPLPAPPAARQPYAPATPATTAAPVPSMEKLAEAGKAAIDKTDTDEDDLYADAVAVVREMGKASASLLQRRLRIGYNRASRLIETMEARGVIGPAADNPTAPREVLSGAEDETDSPAHAAE